MHGTLLGMFGDHHFEQETVRLGDGDAFAAYTDGLVEARTGDSLYGVEGVAASFERNAAAAPSATSLARSLYSDAVAFGSIVDDTVVVTLTQNPAI